MCGLCRLKDCECECHELDNLPNEHLKQILVRYGNHDFIDVANLSRNHLFKLMCESANSQELLAQGVKLDIELQSQMYVEDEDEADDDVLAEIARMTPVKSNVSTFPRLSTPEKTIKKKVLQNSKQTPKLKAKAKAKPKVPKPKAKSTKTSAQKKRERALKRCAT